MTEVVQRCAAGEEHLLPFSLHLGKKTVILPIALLACQHVCGNTT